MIRLFYPLVIGLFIVASALNATAQLINVSTSTGINRIKQDEWRFQAGDSLVWANLTYNHRHWAKTSPRLSLTNNPALWKKGRGWFRRTMRSKRLSNTKMTMTIRQFGTSEVYFDGRKIATLRPAEFDSGGSQQIVAFVPFEITDTNQHLLAVRYAFRREPLMGLSVDKEPFQLELQSSDRAALDLIESQSVSAGVQFLLVGVFGALSLLHLLFYRANPNQRVNLFLALTMLAFSLLFLVEKIDDQSGTLTLNSLLIAVSELLANVALGLLLLSVYIYLNRRLGPVFWGIVVFLVGIAAYNTFISLTPEDSAWIPFVLVLIEYTRVSWLAKRRNPDPDARLPWNSLKFSLYSLLAIIILGIIEGVANSLIPDKSSTWLIIPMAVLGMVALFSIPVGLSFSLVGDYARTYQSLSQQLNEVNRLSAQTLAQEQEKQQLLASQNERLEQQVADRTTQLKQSMTELRQTQTQLIQREKLASLGELTAGIAHEIQNPLNFVNNFSEVSSELVDELKEGPLKQLPDPDKAYAAEILGDLTLNLQKITHHGKRADMIIKGMLEHSRPAGGQKSPTDLNALTEEYLKLAYHGLRAKDKNFDAKLTTHFAPQIGLVEVAPQDIGRVLLNLFNNAFYAMRERQKQMDSTYQPEVTVRSTETKQGIEIQIQDNGTGIPEKVQQKIFQPFFTTKPTGEGTGLGLSLSYDIVTKGHSGSLEVASQEGVGTTFVISLPKAKTSAFSIE